MEFSRKVIQMSLLSPASRAAFDKNRFRAEAFTVCRTLSSEGRCMTSRGMSLGVEGAYTLHTPIDLRRKAGSVRRQPTREGPTQSPTHD